MNKNKMNYSVFLPIPFLTVDQTEMEYLQGHTMISVLYTDDEPALLELGKIFLERTGDFTVTTATGADEALHMLEKEKFDVIVSDYQMPGMDGIEFLAEVRNNYGNLPFILFTGKGREEVVIQAINSGADFYIQKGGEPRAQFAELSHKIKTAVSGRRAEEALCRSEEQSRDILSAMPDIVMVYREGIIVYANQMTLEVSGYSSEELIGSYIIKFIDPGYHKSIRKKMDMRNSGENTDDYEIELADKSGSLHHVIVRTAPMIFNGLPSTVVILTDITERKRMETALRESETLYRTIFENTGAGTIIIREDNIIEKASAVFSELSGYLLSEIEGKKSWTEFVAPEDLEIMKIYHISRRKNPDTEKKTYEFRFLDRYGKIKDCINNVAIIPGTGMSVASVVDISYKKEAETELKNNNEELNASYEQIKAAEEELKAQYATLAESEGIIRLSEERLLMAQEIGHTGCWEYNINSGKIWASDEALRIFGISDRGEELPTEEIESCIPEWGKNHKALFDLISEGKKYDTEFYIHPADGSAPRYIHSVAKKIEGHNNSPTRILGIIQDITEHKNAKEALRLKNYAVESSMDGIGIADLSGIMTYANPAFISIMGYDDLSEVIGLHYQNFPFNTEEGQEIFNELKEHGRWSGEVMGRKKNKTPVVLDFSINMINNSEGIPVAMMCTFSDITKSKLAEEALKKSENRYRSIFDNANDEIIIHQMAPDHHPGRITEVNRRAIKTLGYSRDELLNMTIEEISHPHTTEECNQINNIILRDNRAIFPATQFTKDGRKIPVEVSTNYYEYESSPECVAVIRDLSERITAQETLSRAHNQLKLISGITRHDLYNQVTAMMGYLEIMKLGENDISNGEYIEKLDASLRRIYSIVEKTKYYGEIGINEPLWQNCHISADRAVKELSPENAVIRNDISTNTEILADTLLFRVFYNLIENSQRHGGDITTIRFSTEESGDDCLIIYSDNGNGIPTAEKEKIFEKSYGKNTGLGLFFSKEILATTGITIRENGICGEGARFEIRVPKGSWRTAGPDN
ncbi:PAS domain S-box protein [Methanoplanus endosymbiosus]|uniref:histidine kinase n=1 Tax=Methanoplanus endosymbiosus TaxID=33865 RepID=A0A9E7PN12_9EURY|nr:PAS domain S-box protein [Methanoplanus endosymbiosus]UUX93248.1 PAS domain S-box protein [Methanoplanus endosymbiosus]